MSALRAEGLAAVMRFADDVDHVGMGPIWDHILQQDDTPTRTLLLGIVGPLATCLRETGYGSSP